MNYSKTIREYCLKNPGMVFDMSYERKNHFEMVPYKTFCKILSRLEDDGILKTYSKGVYLINSDKETEDPIIAFYANDNTGLVIGYKMYNDLGVSSHTEKPIVIYTNAMDTTTKNIGDDYRLVLFESLMDECIKKLIICLELIENKNDIIDRDLYRMNEILIDYLQDYSDSALEEILESHKYQYSTIVTLDECLKNLNIKNHAIDIAIKCRYGE